MVAASHEHIAFCCEQKVRWLTECWRGVGSFITCGFITRCMLHVKYKEIYTYTRVRQGVKGLFLISLSVGW
jgi:hypothetical protein